MPARADDGDEAGVAVQQRDDHFDLARPADEVPGRLGEATGRDSGDRWREAGDRHPEHLGHADPEGLTRAPFPPLDLHDVGDVVVETPRQLFLGPPAGEPPGTQPGAEIPVWPP